MQQFIHDSAGSEAETENIGSATLISEAVDPQVVAVQLVGSVLHETVASTHPPPLLERGPGLDNADHVPRASHKIAYDQSVPQNRVRVYVSASVVV